MSFAYQYALASANYPTWSSGDQQPVHSASSQGFGLLTAGAIAGGAFASGFARVGKQRMWDYYLRGFRAFEEFTPSQIGRTLQLSSIFSQFGSEANRPFNQSAVDLFKLSGVTNQAGGGWLDILSRTTGQPTGTGSWIAEHGLRFEPSASGGPYGKLWSGEKLILPYASAHLLPMMPENTGTRPIETPNRFVTGYARHLGFGSSGVRDAQERARTYRAITAGPEIFGEEKTIFYTGGKTKAQFWGRQAAALGTEMVEGFNRFAAGVGFNFRGKRYDLGVTPSTGLKTLGKLTAKLAAVVGGGILAYQTADWMARQLPLPLFNEGITSGLAKIAQGVHKTVAGIADTFGYTTFAKEQEKVAPGSTSLMRLSAFPIAGALTGAGLYWFSGIQKRARMMYPLSGAGLTAEAATLAFKQAERHTVTGPLLRKLGVKSLSEWTKWAKKGALIATIPVLPFIFGALLPSQTPEELDAIYSGQQEVPVRKGRYWEMGRSPFEGGQIDYFRPHRLALATLGRTGQDISLYGEEDPNPISKWITENLTYDLEKEKYYERPYPMCLHPDTEVFTSDGYKKIKDISPGELVLNFSGNWTKVIDSSSRKCTEERVLRLKIASDGRVIRATPDHRILSLRNNSKNAKRHNRCRDKEKVISNGTLEWVHIKDLKRSDFVVIPIPQGEVQSTILDLALLLSRPFYKDKIFTDKRVSQDLVLAIHSELRTIEASKTYNIDYKYLHFCRHHPEHKRTFPRYLEITEELAYFFGLWMAEGWTDRGCISFAFHKDEQETYAQSVLKIGKKYFDVDGSIVTATQNGIKVHINSTLLKDIIEALFGKKRAKDKSIPDFIFHWPVNLKKEFIKGLVRGDGSIEKTREITFSSASSQLVGSLRLLLLSIGIKSSIKKIVPKVSWKPALVRGRLIPKIVSYALSISGSDFNLFSIFEDELDNKKKSSGIDRKGILYQNFFYVPVREITEEFYDGDVFDLEVSEGESFLTTCIVHNSGRAFADVPLLGPLLASTIGAIVKPPALMHTDEWQQEGGNGDEYLFLPKPYGERRALGMGELPPGTPVSPFRIDQALGEQIYRITEAAGLKGFLTETLGKDILGTTGFFTQSTQLETAEDMYSTGRSFWDLSLGGAGGQSEFWRRLWPRKRTQIETYNPIRNTQPEYLPGPGERGPDLLHGDPFSSITEGEFRLPGEAYEAIHPELQGLEPDDYPLVWKHKILGDVAPYTTGYDVASSLMREKIKSGDASEEEENIFRETVRQVGLKRDRRQFQEYTYKDKSADDLAETNREIANAGLWGDLQSTMGIGSYWEWLSHAANEITWPIEQLTPLSPFAKLNPARTAIEDYEATQVYGTTNAFWDKPWENFLKPAIYSAAHLGGYEGVPEGVQEGRALNQYFDVLEYLKYTALKRQAYNEGDMVAVNELEQRSRETLIGVNPFTMNFAQIYRALPKADRDYFAAFSAETDPEKQKEILSMVPENEQALYQARWAVAARQAAYEESEDSILPSPGAQATIDEVNELSRTEGFPVDDSLFDEYQSEKMAGESYGDWYRRTKLIPNIVRSLPGPSWTGFHPAVDLEDVKLRVVENEARTIQEFDLWPSRQRAAAYKPYLDEVTQQLTGAPRRSASDIEEEIRALLGQSDITDISILTSQTPSTDDSTEITMTIKEHELIERQRKRKYLLGE